MWINKAQIWLYISQLRQWKSVADCSKTKDRLCNNEWSKVDCRWLGGGLYKN